VTEELVLDASFALHWCFEDEATGGTETVLAALQNQETTAFVPAIWMQEVLRQAPRGVGQLRHGSYPALISKRPVR
jgi:hypothetical protein